VRTRERGGRLARSVQRAPRRRTDGAARRPVLRGPGRHVDRPRRSRSRSRWSGRRPRWIRGSARPNPCATATRWAAPRSRRPRAYGSSTARPAAGSSWSRSPSRTGTRRRGSRTGSRDGRGARSRGRGRGGRRTRGADARRDQAGHGPRAGPARPRRRVVVPRRPVGRVVGRVRAEAALAVRPARRRTGGGGRAHARGRRAVARRTWSVAVRRRGGADPTDRAPDGRRAAGVPPQHLHGVARRHAFDRQRGAGLPLLARRRHHQPVRRARRPLARTAPAGRRRAACSCRT
jgi:hypothetical protein